MELSLLVSIFAIFITSFSLLPPSREYEISNQLEGCLEKERKDKVKAILYDISDDCTHNSRRNYTLNHFIERIKIYNEENFNYEIITIQLKKNDRRRFLRNIKI